MAPFLLGVVLALASSTWTWGVSPRKAASAHSTAHSTPIHTSVLHTVPRYTHTLVLRIRVPA
eukprot:1218191-Rhodomonas_salina.2